MDWVAEQQNLGGLGLAGICREVTRVLCATVFNVACLAPLVLLTMLLLGGIDVLSSRVDSNQDSLLRLAAYWTALLLFKLVYFGLCYSLTLFCTTAYVFLVASLYCTGGDFQAANRCLDALPADPVRRLHRTLFLLAIPILIFYAGVQAWIALQQLDAPGGVILPLQLMGAAACLAGAAYVAVVCHLACVVSLLEDAWHFSAIRRSRALVAGKFWPAATVLLTLDGCIMALLLMASSPLLVAVDDALGLGIAFPLVVGAGVIVALWAVLVVTLVAHPVVYLVCKNHHHEVVDKVHLNYVGEYDRLAVDGDNGVELQPVVKMAPQVTSTA